MSIKVVMNRDVWSKIDNLGLNGTAYLARNDSYTFWEQAEGLVLTGHTGTNLMDIHMLTLKINHQSPKGKL